MSKSDGDYKVSMKDAISALFLVVTLLSGCHDQRDSRSVSETGRIPDCYPILTQIDSAKENLAMKEQLNSGVDVEVFDLKGYLPQVELDKLYARKTFCDGGVIAIGKIGEQVRCSVHGSLPEIERHIRERRR
jgi:hypothetical protein